MSLYYFLDRSVNPSIFQPALGVLFCLLSIGTYGADGGQLHLVIIGLSVLLCFLFLLLFLYAASILMFILGVLLIQIVLFHLVLPFL